MAEQQRFNVRVAGSDIAVSSIGPYCQQNTQEAKTLILIHGLGGSQESWQMILPQLVQRHSVMRFDLPAHGSSSCALESGDLFALTTLVSDLIDVLGLSCVHILGHSLGGAIALRLLAMYPQKVRSLCLLAPVGLGSRVTMEFVSGLSEVTSAEAMQVLMAMATYVPLVGIRAAQVLVRRLEKPGVRETLRKIVHACFTPTGEVENLRSIFEQAQVPIHLIWGKEDHIVPYNHSFFIQQKRKELLPYVLLPGTGHLPHLEQSQHVAQNIEEFLIKCCETN